MTTVVCANCGTVNDAANAICQSCGKTLPKVEAVASDRTVVVNRAKATPPPAPAPAAPPPPPVQASTPPQPASAAAPVPPPPPAYAAPAPMMGTPIRGLGVRSDGWSDVIEDAAGLEEEIQKAFVEELKSAAMPGVVVSDSLLSNGQITRKYQVVYNGNGANVAVRIAAYGKNLLAGWDLYTKRKPNWMTIGILGGAVFVFTLVYEILVHGFYGAFFAGLLGTISMFVSWLLVPTLWVLLFGKILKDDWLGFFVTDLDEFAADDAVALTSVVDTALAQAVEKAQAKTLKAKK